MMAVESERYFLCPSLVKVNKNSSGQFNRFRRLCELADVSLVRFEFYAIMINNTVRPIFKTMLQTYSTISKNLILVVYVKITKKSDKII